MSDDAPRTEARPDPEPDHGHPPATGYAGPTWTTRSASVMQTLLLGALVSVVVGGLSFQLATGETSFDRPGQLILLFVDLAPVLWFAAAPVILHALRWRAIGQRFRWVMIAAIIAAGVSVAVRVLLGQESLLAIVLDPFTLAFVVWIAAAVRWTSVRVRRIAYNDGRGVTIVGLGLGFAVAAIGMLLGALRLVLVGEVVAPGTVTAPVTTVPTTALLIAATFAMIAGLFWLTDRTRNR